MYDRQNKVKRPVRIAVIVAALVAVVLAVGGGLLYAYLFSAHSAIIQASHEYEPYSTVSPDGAYVLVVEVVDGGDVTEATFHIETAGTGSVVYECAEAYRTMDLKSIEWDAMDVVVDSGDVGVITYGFQDGSWEKR